MARRFQLGFGGIIGRFNAALDFLRLAMRIGGDGNVCCHCVGGNKQDGGGGAIT
jgi:hypothetical protein